MIYRRVFRSLRSRSLRLGTPCTPRADGRSCHCVRAQSLHPPFHLQATAIAIGPAWDDRRSRHIAQFHPADNRRIGQAAGRWALQALGGKGKIVELEGLMTSSPARERHQGFWEGVDRAANPQMEVVFEADTAWLEPNARREMESALAAHPRIDLVFAHNDPAAHGAYLAAKAVGREREMKFVGIDALPHEGQHYVRQGVLDVTFSYATCAKEAIELARKLLAKQSVPKELVLGARRFDKATIESGGVAVE